MIDLRSDASIEEVANVMLHPSCKDLNRVLENAVQGGRLSYQASSMVVRALVERVPMDELLQHPFFGVAYSATFLRSLENKAKFSEVLDPSW